MQWIEIPELSATPFSLSSLFLGEMNIEARQTGNLPINGNHRFRSDSRLGFLTFIYNPERSAAEPDIAVQVQIIRDGHPVVTKPLVKVQRNLLVSAIPYSEDIALSELPAGKYILQITAIDRLAKRRLRNLPDSLFTKRLNRESFQEYQPKRLQERQTNQIRTSSLSIRPCGVRLQKSEIL